MPDDLGHNLRRFAPLDQEPSTVHELITRQKVDDLAMDMEKAHAAIRQEIAQVGASAKEQHTAIRVEVAELRRVIYGLIFSVVGTVIVQVLLRVFG